MEINQIQGNYGIYETSPLKNVSQVQNPYVNNSIFDNTTGNINFEYDSFESTQAAESAPDLSAELKATKEEQGLLGKLWDGFKNLTGIGAGSNKAEEKIKQYENGEISYEEAKSALDKYKAGQDMCVDVVADIASGILAVGAFALAVPTGGASLAVGLGAATAVGAGVKIGVKAGDAAIGGREYSGKDLLHDAATGAINGVLAPVTNGIGASVTKTIGKKLGLTVIKEGGEEIVEQVAKQGIKQGIKSVITQEGVEVVGGTLAKRVIATGAGMAVDGAIGGAADNMVRAALDGEDVLKAGVQGAVGGLIMAPVIGGGFKIAGKAGKALNNKLTTSKVFSNGMDTAFKQGDAGDCALLSVIDGMMKNGDAADKIKKSITKSVGGDYHVNIGGKSITVPKSVITDEMLADSSGIKIFEAAYKQIAGLDGGFADDVARHFGLNPVHIASDSITDETLDKIATEGGSVLSLGGLIDNADGTTSRHYFSIRNVDPSAKTVTVVDPYDTAKLIDLSYDDVKKLGISIDGGTLRETTLPNSVRTPDELQFYGLNRENYMLDRRALEAGTQYLTAEGTPEMEALNKLVDDVYVVVKDKDSALSIFEEQYKALGLDSQEGVFILNPQSARNNAKNIGTSNSYMTQWYREASGLPESSIINCDEIQELITRAGGSGKVTIVVPDDCAITGRSMIVETAKTLNQMDLPEGVTIDLVYSPMIDSHCSKGAFTAMTDFDMDALSKTGMLSQSDYPVIEEFMNKFRGRMNITSAADTLEANPYFMSEYFRELQSANPELAQALEAILTSNGTRAGFGRPGTSGVMISTPTANGVDLKCPNNNVFGASPYALASGATPTTIKRPSQKVPVKKWQNQLAQILEKINESMRIAQ